MAIRRRGCGDGNGGSGNMRGRREVEETTAVKVAEKKTERNGKKESNGEDQKNNKDARFKILERRRMRILSVTVEGKKRRRQRRRRRHWSAPPSGASREKIAGLYLLVL